MSERETTTPAMDERAAELYAEFERRRAAALAGGPPERHAAQHEKNKMSVRERIDKMFDPGSLVEDGLLARTLDDGLPADAVVTGLATIGGRPVAFMANDMTVKAGAWGKQTVRKIIRIQEEALNARIPLFYLIDSAGGRLDEQFDIFMDRHHAGRIFYNQARFSGVIPQLCIMFGPSTAGSAYIPSFCDVVVFVDKNASAFLGSSRMAEMATGEKTTDEEMGGAKMHSNTSGLSDYLAKTEDEAIAAALRYLSYLPQHWEDRPPPAPPRDPDPLARPIEQIVPGNQNAVFDVKEVINALVDEESFCEFRARWAKELVVGFARLDGAVVGLVANQSKHKGGVLFNDSSDKGAHFISLCNAYNIPLVFLNDISGFMIGTQTERAGLIRHGSKMLNAIANCSVPRIAVIVRKSYGAGYMAMSGASMQPDAQIALPTAKLAIMSPETAVNAMHAKKIAAMAPDEAAEFIKTERDRYDANLDLFKAASEFFFDSVIPGADLRDELIKRLRLYENKLRDPIPRRNRVLRG